ncbi:OsmC family protein [Micrococcus terreus]|uniref:OsmC family protein n=1 Tax=Micrococcus terreus TaxID=574650 RepID=UPI0021A5F7DF|nr:OsmC family protein [Micrococcus terreus]MCT2089313.1 OsmC family protein [Micrococcus terreus]MDK7702011.1 OsmC family protein [Micrococcus terreus]WOO97313.1 OsmC family protein [Micrococcus terreus]
MAQRIYSTTVTNDGGTAGWVRASDGPQVQTGPPSDPSQGVNPEQFLGMAWSTCLNATVEAVLRDRGVLDPGGADGAPARSRVSVQVVLVREPSGEYAFVPEATVSVAGLEGADLEAVAEAAHARCPVSKLLTGRGEPVVVRTAAWDEGGEKGGDPRTQAEDPLPGTVRGSGAVRSVPGRGPEQSGVAVDSPGQAR